MDIGALVDPTPNVLATLASETIGIGATTSIAVSKPNGVAGTTFSWTVVQSGVTGASASSGATIAQTLSSAVAGVGGTATYTITPTAGTCNGTPVVVVVTVNPLPDASAVDQTICSGTTTNIAITNPNGIAGTTFTWVVQSNVGGVTGSECGQRSYDSPDAHQSDGSSADGYL